MVSKCFQQLRKLLGIKPIITPSKDKQKVHYEQIAEVINAHRNAPQVALINKLNPIIRGWANYYATQVSKVAYRDQDYLTWFTGVQEWETTLKCLRRWQHC